MKKNTNIALIVLETLQQGAISPSDLHKQVNTIRTGLQTINFESTKTLVAELEAHGYASCKNDLISLTKAGNTQAKLYLEQFKQTKIIQTSLHA